MKLFVKSTVAIVAGSLLTILVLKAEPTYFGAAAFLILLPMFFVKPYYYFVFFTIIRPIIDLSLMGNLPGNKLSSLVVIPLIFLCAKDMLLKPGSLNAIRRNPVLKKINFIFFLLLATNLLSFIYTENRIVSLQDLLRFISIIVSVNYAVIYFSFSPKKKDEWIRLVLLSSFVPLAFGFKQLMTHTGIQETGYNRLYGTFAHCNVFAQYLVMTIFLSVHLFSRSPKKSAWRRLSWMLMVLSLVSLYFTYTRTLWIAFAMAVLVYIFLKRGSSKKIVYIGMILLVFTGLYSQIKGRFSDTADKQVGRRTSWQWRVELWRDSLKDLKRHPLLGNGLGMFEYQIGVMAHNDFIRMAYESGIPSALIFFIFFVFLFLYSVGASRKAPEGDEPYFVLAASLVSALFISSLAVNTLRSTVIMFYYLTVIVVLIQGAKPKTVYKNITRQ